jgi:histidinol-phosphatase
MLEAVAEVARIAGDVALSRFRSNLAVEAKGDGSPVTIADRAAEEAARAWIMQRFPDDAILGEEFGAAGGTGRRRWFIDPIDGTLSFVRDVPLWGTLIAVADGDKVLAGAINCAAAGELVAAAIGEGCWWNGVRCRVSAVDELSAATILITDDRFRGHEERAPRWRALAGGSRMVRTWGDCFGYVLVATGRAEVMVDNRMSAWDATALQPVIIESGGVFTDWRGRATAFGGDVIATNAALDRVVRAQLLDGTPVGSA